jgi:hypothetical protein
MAVQAHTTKHFLGKAVLAASSLLNSAGQLHASFQAPGSADAGNSGATTKSASVDEQAPVGQLSIPQDTAALADYEREMADMYAEPRRAINVSIDAAQIIERLYDSATASDILSFLDQNNQNLSQLYQDTLLRRALVNTSYRWASNPSKFANIVGREEIALALKEALASETGWQAPYADLYMALPPERRTEELTALLRQNAILQARSVLCGETTFRSLPVSRFVPAGLFSGDEIETIFGSDFENADAAAKIELIRFFNLDKVAVRSRIAQIPLEAEQVLHHLMPEEIPFSMTHATIAFMQSNTTATSEFIRRRPVLLNHPRLLAAALDLIEKDITLVPNLPADSNCAKACASAIRKHLSNPSHVSRIVSTISQDLESVLAYPSLIITVPEIQHAIRLKIYSLVESRSNLISGQSRGPLVKNLAAVVHKLAPDVPDVAHLIRSKDELELCEDSLPVLYSTNPRAFLQTSYDSQRLYSRGHVECATTAGTLSALGIEGVFRFSNAAEIIVNRIQSSHPLQQARLSKAFTTQHPFMSRVYSLFVDPAKDPRPVCVVVMASPQTDHRGALNSQEETGFASLIDSLTSFYRVVYYEPSNVDNLVSQIAETHRNLGKKVELLFVAGHGNEQGILLSGNSFFTGAGAKKLHSLQDALDERCRIVLWSCLSAKRFSGKPSLVEEVHKVVPFTTVLGPNESTPISPRFKATGEFDLPFFHTADLVVCRPHTEEPVIEQHASITVPILARIKLIANDLWENLELLGAGIGVGLLGGLGLSQHHKSKKSSEASRESHPARGSEQVEASSIRSEADQ